MTGSSTLVEVADMYADLGRELIHQASPDRVFELLTTTAVRRVPGAEYAGITRLGRVRMQTVAPTDDLVERVDRIQYALGHGPCVDAVLQEQVFHADDLRSDPRWPEFGRQAAEHGIVSMLSFRLYLEDSDEAKAGLNMYSPKPAAFNDMSRMVGLLLATHGALAVHAATKAKKVENLEIALESSREIGIAMGVLMNQYKITRDQAFGLLRVASQNSHRKLAAIAADVADTGVLSMPGQIASGFRAAPERGSGDPGHGRSHRPLDESAARTPRPA